jgi:hypothetical protein
MTGNSEDIVTCMCVLSAENVLVFPAVVSFSALNPHPLYNQLCRGLKGGHSWLFGLGASSVFCLWF